MYERTRCLLAFGLALALGACDSGGGGGDGGATTTASGCPADVQPASASETPCSEEGLVCDFGGECCCGSCAPSYICTCYGENGWSCNYTDHCLGGGFCGSGGAGASGGGGGAQTTGTGCPADVQPANDSETPCFEEGLVCDYGSECCCGSCAPSYICTCYGENGWSCNYTDHCLGGGFCGSGGAGASGGAGGTGGAGGVGGAGGAGGQGG